MEPGEGGREGPKSSSEDVESASSFGLVEGIVERSAGGRDGPIGRRLGMEEVLGEELRERFRTGEDCCPSSSLSSSSSALRLFETCGGGVGPITGMAF